MTRHTLHKLAMEDAILLAMLRARGPITWNQARFILGGAMPTTTLRMLIAEGIVRNVMGHKCNVFEFTEEGRDFAECVELRLFEAGIIALADRSVA